MKQNKKKEALLTQARLKEVLKYNKITGEFIRLVATSNRVKVGELAGSINKYNGYRQIRIDNERYQAHRLVWLYIHGEFPKNDIDHINQIKDDNRISNLRDVAHSENHKNRSLSNNNTSGVMGVYWDKRDNKWLAQIKVNDKQLHLGYFFDKEDAISARKEANIKYKFHKNHGKIIC